MLMVDFHLGKTRRSKFLAPKLTLLTAIDLFLQCFIRGLVVIFTSLLLIEPSLRNSSLSFVLVMLLFMFLLGFFDLLYGFRFSKIPYSNIDLLKRTTKTYLLFDGWVVEHDNKKFMYAWKNEGLITHNFYMIYEEGKAYANSLREYPWPFSIYASRRDINVLRNGYSSTDNKKRNEEEDSDEPSIR